MAQYPIESGDQGAIAEGVNYLLSGPAGLGQNFQGFSDFVSAYLRPSTRQPWDLPYFESLDPLVPQGLNPSIYLDIPINNITVPTNPGREIVLTFTTPEATAPFQYGDRLDVIGVDPGFYNDSYTVFSCTTTDVTLFTSIEYTWPAYVSGGSVGRDYLNYPLDTDCNARVTVTGPSDQVFVSAQLTAQYEYLLVNSTGGNDAYFVTAQIVRGRGFPDTTPGSNDYLFGDFVVVSSQTIIKTATLVDFSDTLDFVFTTVLDQPSFGYYWYILTLQFSNIPGGFPVENNSDRFSLSGTTAAQGATTTYTGITPVTGTGTGLNLVVDVVLEANPGGEDYSTSNTTIDVTTSGQGYRLGDELYIAGTDLGGLSPDNDMTLVVTSVGPPYDITIGRVQTDLRSLTAQVIKQ